MKTDATIRNIDDEAYRALEAHAARVGRDPGEVLSEAIQAYPALAGTPDKGGSLRDLTREKYPKGAENLSCEVDAVVYGLGRRPRPR